VKKWILGGALLGLVAIAALAHLASHGAFGREFGAGEIVPHPRDPARVAMRADRQAAHPHREAFDKQILFGDLHVHSTFSFDAFSISLPMVQGEGAHPPADACDFARFCSGLDFWSINDHAEGLTARQWRETREMVRACNDAAGDPASPDLVTLLGWEWTQIGSTPENHYGHKNVVLFETDDARVPSRPIASRDQLFPGQKNPYTPMMRLFMIAMAAGDGGRQPYHDFARFLQERVESPVCDDDALPSEWPADCRESASTPGELYRRMDAMGEPYMVIPHGNTWGFYTPPGTTWDKQLAAHSEPERHEPLIEVFSGHGNIEQVRPWRAVERSETGEIVCPRPSEGYTPECWRAGEIIAARCLEAGEPVVECEARAVQARAHHVAAVHSGHLTVPGASVADWLDAGQCTDCYMPAYNYRPGGSVQYALALRDLATPGGAKRFRFGLIGSSDVHTARAGNGYKETRRRLMTDAGLGNLGPPAVVNARDPEPRSIPPEEIRAATPYFERFASFFGAGGLVAVHAAGRDRAAVWNALDRKEVYATSGDRILLWFDLIEPGAAGAEPTSRHPMGSSLVRDATPRFEVRAAGAFEQLPGCPEDTLELLGAERTASLCGGECNHPSSERRRIERIEVVRIRPRVSPDESIDALVEDPWRTLACPASEPGCRVTFDDPDFAGTRRDTVYYVRAIQAATPTINGDNLRCERDASGTCISVDPCFSSDPTAYDDDCLSPTSERAWSSPIFLDHPEQVLQFAGG